MKKSISLTAAVFFVAYHLTASERPIEIVLKKGPRAGQTARVLQEVGNSDMLSRTLTNRQLSVTVGGRKTTIPVELRTRAFNCVVVHTNGHQQPTMLIELEVRSATDTPFYWSHWFSEQPRDLAVFTTASGNSYACHVGSGVFLYPINENKSSEVAFREFWEHVPGESGEYPDAVKVLTMGVLSDNCGREAFSSRNAVLFHDVFVDNLFEVGGELRVTVHGRNPEPKYTFALRNNKWELESASPGAVLLPTGTNVTYAKIKQAEETKDIRQMAELLPEIETLWPGQPYLYFRCLHKAAFFLVDCLPQFPEAMQPLLETFSRAVSKPPTMGGGSSTSDFTLEYQRDVMLPSLAQDEVKTNRSHLIALARFVGQLRSRRVERWEENERDATARGFQHALSQVEPHLTGILLKNCARFPSTDPANAEFIQQIITAAQLTEAERKVIVAGD